MLARAAALSRNLLAAPRATHVADRLGALPRPHLHAPHPSRKLGIVAAVVLVLAGGFMWLRDSPLVAVQRVTVTGADGPQAVSIRHALEDAAVDQTTLHVDTGALKTAVAQFPIVADVKAETRFPHGLAIEVVQHQAIGSVGGVPVAPDGALLRGAQVRGVPAIATRTTPAGTKVTDPKTEAMVAVAAAAPSALRPRIARVFVGPRGLTARLSDGPAIYFGGSDRAAAKWAAAAAVLASPSSQGATHVDVRFPERPAAGGLEQAAAQEPAGGAASTTP